MKNLQNLVLPERFQITARSPVAIPVLIFFLPENLVFFNFCRPVGAFWQFFWNSVHVFEEQINPISFCALLLFPEWCLTTEKKK